MSETARFKLTLLDAAQAQKHVTVNEAFARLDALAAARVEDLALATPPASPAEGDVYGVPAGATDAWVGQEGRLAVWLNGGWEFMEPVEGWQVWNAATNARVTRVAGDWIEAGPVESAGGAQTLFRIAETDHAVSAGATSTTAAFIPDKAIVLGVSARVLTTLGGASSWDLGVAGATNRYGSGFGTGAGELLEGVTGQPQAYYGGTPLVLTAQGGSFTGGSVRIAVHYLAISGPLAV
ncbi:MAG: DUF2793 domain-containing protein [Pseudomonadota bacterium]